MSLFDVIFSQQTILIGGLLFVLPLLAALALVLNAQLRQRRRTRAARRAAAMVQAAQPPVAEAPASVDDSPAAAVSQPPSAPVQAVTPASPAAPAAAPGSVGSGSTAAANGQPSTGEAATEPENAPPSGAMQDLLSSVFGDDEVSDARAALMQDLDEIAASDLAEHAAYVAARLHANHPTLISRKEQGNGF